MSPIIVFVQLFVSAPVLIDRHQLRGRLDDGEYNRVQRGVRRGGTARVGRDRSDGGVVRERRCDASVWRREAERIRYLFILIQVA